MIREKKFLKIKYSMELSKLKENNAKTDFGDLAYYFADKVHVFRAIY